MTHITKEILSRLRSRYRANLINSCSGYRSANLLATKSLDGIENVAVFNSVAHVGSNPAIVSFLLRPHTVERHTYENLKATKQVTINQIHTSIISQAHQTAAKYERDVSEFKAVGLTPQYLDKFSTPYVKESLVKMGCTYVNEYEIKENGCILVLVAIEHIYYPREIQHSDGWLDLEKTEGIAITALDGYSRPSLVQRFQYAQPNKKTTILDKERKS